MERIACYKDGAMAPEEVREALDKLLGEVRALRAEMRASRADELLTAEEAAKVLGTTPAAIRQRVWRGTIKVVREGGRRVRFRRGDLL